MRFPAVPILLEMSPDERLRSLLAQETPDCVVCAVGEASLTLYPPVGVRGEYELGLTIVCSLGTFDTLITGDMDSKTERALLDAYPLPDIEVLLVGHHGSRYSTSEELLETVTPEVGVVSVGSNSYGHPTRDALLRLTDAGVTVYRTDLQGNIYITVN